MSEGSSDEGSQPQADTAARQNDRPNHEAKGDARSAAEPVPTQTELAPESQEDDLDAGWEELLGDALQDRPTRSLRGATDPSRTRTSVSMRAPTLPHVPVVSVNDAPGSGAATTSSVERSSGRAGTPSEPIAAAPPAGAPAPDPTTVPSRSEADQPVESTAGAQTAGGALPPEAVVPPVSTVQPVDKGVPRASRGLLAAVAGLTAMAAVGGYLWLSGSQPNPDPIPDAKAADQLAVHDGGAPQDARAAGLLPGQNERPNQPPASAKEEAGSAQADPARPTQGKEGEPSENPSDAEVEPPDDGDEDATVAVDAVEAQGKADQITEGDSKPDEAHADDPVPQDSSTDEDPDAATKDESGAKNEADTKAKDDPPGDEHADIPVQRRPPPGTPRANARALARIPVEADDQVPLGGIGRSGIHVDKAGFGREYKEYTCQGENAEYSLGKRHKAHLCVRLVHGRKAETVTIRWLRKGKQVASKKVRVHAKRHVDGAYDVFKFRKGKHRPGAWSVVVQTARGVELLRYDFRVRR